MQPDHAHGARRAEDARAVARVLGGDTEAFAVLVRRHQQYLFDLLGRHLPRAEVAEAAQEAFITAYEKLPQLRDHTCFRAWLTSLALRRAVSFWREAAARREVPLDLDADRGQRLEAQLHESSRQRHEEALSRSEAGSVVSWLLGHVKPEDRLALGLYYAHGHEAREVAAMLGWSVGKVKVRLHRARKAMARVLAEAAY